MRLRNASASVKLEAHSIPEPNSGCTLWLAGTESGYGRMRVAGKMVLAHRASYESYKGPIPAGMCVLHKCDTPQCVNPNHLFLGTQLENVQDRHAKGRDSHHATRGERHGRSKLTQAQVDAIRIDARSHRAIGIAFEISRQMVGRIKAGLNWVKAEDKQA